MTHHHLRHALLIALIILLPFAGWFGWRAYTLVSGVEAMTGKTVPRTKTEPRVVIPPLNGNKRINFLILGSDNDRKKQEARPLAQSIIVVTVNPRTDQVGMLSIPRDFYVPIRGHGMDKIDLAYKYGGVQLARETVERLFHIPIHYYAWVGLTGFIRVINTFGGISLDAAHPVLDDSYPNDLNATNPYSYERIFIPPGWQHMDGATALEYVRSRHGDLIGDFGRSARQQQVLLRLQQKMNTLDILRNLPTLVDDLSCCVRTDLGLEQLYQIAELARHITLADVTQKVLQAPDYSHYGWTADGQSIVIPDWAKIRPVIRQMFAPIPPASPVSRVTPRARPAVTPTASPRTPAHPRPAQPTPRPAPHLRGALLYVANGNLFELHPDGSTSQLTSTGDAAMPALSPDGKQVAFVRFQPNVSDLWVMNLRTRAMRILTHDTNPLGQSPPDVRNNLWAAWPAWSADGRFIVYSTDRAKLNQPPSDARPTDLAIWEIPAAGGIGRELTVPYRGAGGDIEAAWRPGHRQFVFAQWNYATPSNQPYSRLVLYDTATGQETPLTPAGDRIMNPSWDRSGRHLVFVRSQGGQDQVVVATLTDSSSGPALAGQHILATGHVAQPSFAPNGRWISYLRTDKDGFYAYLVSSRGGPPVRLSDLSASVDARSRPLWLP